MWFRRDLRLADLPALAKAADAGPVVGLFVLDDRLLDSSGGPRLAALAGCLHALHREMDGRLVVRHGDPVGEVLDVAQRVGASEVFASADYAPYGRRRDAAVAAALSAAGVSLRLVGSPYAVKPGSIVTGGGTPYRVFTPFSRAWMAHGWPEPVAPRPVMWVDPGQVGSAELPAPPSVPGMPAMGERAAHDRLEAFVDSGRLDRYGDERDLPGRNGTSRLSADLRFGTLHPRTVLARLGDQHRVFRNELAWREFYADVLFHRPESAWQTMNPKMAAMRHDSGPLAEARFAAWCQGRTGYPIVDAGMRQLAGEGFVHNRVRMIVASFLVKDLHLPWQWGARWFMQHLIDGDLASNQHGWQWTAGTGTDAAPYFRIFNPVSQGAKFDPDGTYVRRWIPEIAHLADKVVHAPWTSPAPPAGYPAPIVDHAIERAESLARLAEL